MKIRPEEVLKVLYAIEVGHIRVKPLRCPQSVQSGNIPYDASNGWRLIVFSESNAWDYLDSIVLPDGTEIDFWEQGLRTGKWNDGFEEVREYEPSEEVGWLKYRLPGYLKHEKCDCRAVGCTEEVSNDMLN